MMQGNPSANGAGRYVVFEGGSLNAYESLPVGEDVLDTPVGQFSTQMHIQQRENSSRRLLLWLAPELSFLPIRIEQRKNEETKVALILESVEGLGRSVGSTS